MITYRNFIDGEWTESASKETAPHLNPADIRDVLSTTKLSTRAEAGEAVVAAYNAFRHWKCPPAPTRSKIVARFLNGEIIQLELPPNFAQTIKEPHGGAVQITPWNFPVGILVWKIAPALVARDTIVFKPAEATTATAIRICELFAEAGVPKGVLNMIFGAGAVVGDEIASHAAAKRPFRSAA